MCTYGNRYVKCGESGGGSACIRRGEAWIMQRMRQNALRHSGYKRRENGEATDHRNELCKSICGVFLYIDI